MCRQPGEESDGEYFGDSSSDVSSDSEQDRGGGSKEQLNYLKTSDSSSDEGESESSQGCLLFEYLARDQPYCREPLADKVTFLFHP